MTNDTLSHPWEMGRGHAKGAGVGMVHIYRLHRFE